jgi:hypothetical protein
METKPAPAPIDPRVTIGHVHLKVAVRCELAMFTRELDLAALLKS